jgi:hypothetical protein
MSDFDMVILVDGDTITTMLVGWISSAPAALYPRRGGWCSTYTVHEEVCLAEDILNTLIRIGRCAIADLVNGWSVSIAVSVCGRRMLWDGDWSKLIEPVL